MSKGYKTDVSMKCNLPLSPLSESIKHKTKIT